MEKYWKHFKTIFKHKLIVMITCFRAGIIWRGLLHDNSKFGPTEFFTSAKYFQGTSSPIDAEKKEKGYSYAWQHHKGKNPHHWEYWIDFDNDGSVIASKIPYRYVVEMVCDWVGAGMVYCGENWTQSEPLDYYYKVRAGRHFNPETEELLITFLTLIKENGLDEFYKAAQCKGGYTYLYIDYVGIYCP